MNLDLFKKNTDPIREWAPKSHAHTNDPQTSHDAAISAAAIATHQIGKVYVIYKSHPEGLTSEECTALTDIPKADVMKRVTDLQKQGLIMNSGKTRPNASGRKATVWRVC